jgi:hypothetical protein
MRKRQEHAQESVVHPNLRTGRPGGPATSRVIEGLSGNEGERRSLLQWLTQ